MHKLSPHIAGPCGQVPLLLPHLLNQQKGNHDHRLDAIMQEWMDGLHLLVSYVKGLIIYQYCNDKNDADYD